MAALHVANADAEGVRNFSTAPATASDAVQSFDRPPLPDWQLCQPAGRQVKLGAQLELLVAHKRSVDSSCLWAAWTIAIDQVVHESWLCMHQNARAH